MARVWWGWVGLIVYMWIRCFCWPRRKIEMGKDGCIVSIQDRLHIRQKR